MHTIDVRRKTEGETDVLYYPLTDRPGNMVLLTKTGGTILPGSAARYDPFGNYRTTPTTSPGTTAHGFTGHRDNNLGLINHLA